MADYAEWQDFSGTKNKKDTIVHFFDKDVQNPAKTLAEGRPIFETKVFIEKICPGDMLNRVERMVREQDKMDFPDEWQRYLRKEKNEVQGTPLEAWPQIARTQALEMKAMNILTVEHLANLPDSVGHKIMGFNDLKRKAQAFLKAAADSSLFDKMQEENKAKDELLKQQGEILAQLQAQMAELTKGKPGRKKVENADTATTD